MKPVTINISEPVYRRYQRAAQQQGKSTSELIRQAMERYDRDLLDTATSLADLEPVSLGRMKRALRRHDDLLDEMLPPWT